MLDLIQITSDPALARRCDALGGFRLFVDLERMGKAERQAGRNTFISEHQIDDIGRIRDVLQRSPLMVRVNPLHARSAEEVDAVLARGPDCLMLPMFSSGAQLSEFSAIVAGRVPIVALLETARALETVQEWAGTPGLMEIYVGLNDLHLSIGQRFMFEPVADGSVERVANVARAHRLRFGFGGIAPLDHGLLPGRDVLAEHLRLGSGSVILARTFMQAAAGGSYEREVVALREAEARLQQRSEEQTRQDGARIARTIRAIAADMRSAGA